MSRKIRPQTTDRDYAVRNLHPQESTEEGLDQEFNSLDAQREAGEAFITSQQHEGWRLPARLLRRRRIHRREHGPAGAAGG